MWMTGYKRNESCDRRSVLPLRELNGVMRTVQDVLTRLRAEFLEMPGLRLTPEQVQRLCGVERMMCQVVLDRLVNEKFLSANSDGHYTRLRDGAEPPYLHPAKADLRRECPSKKAS